MADRGPVLFHYGLSDEDTPAAQPQQSSGRDTAAGEVDASGAEQTVSGLEQRAQSALGGRPLQEHGLEGSKLLSVSNADAGSPQAEANLDVEGSSKRRLGSSMARVRPVEKSGKESPCFHPNKAAKPPKGGPKKAGKNSVPPKAAVEPPDAEADANERLRREKAEILARTLRKHNAAVFEAQMALLEGPTTEKQLLASVSMCDITLLT